MINKRDSHTDYNNIENIDVPYSIGTIVELKEGKNIFARICQYRITVEGYRMIIYVGLNTNIYEKTSEVECEITAEELSIKWEKTDKYTIWRLNNSNLVSEFPKSYEPFFKDTTKILRKEK